MTMPIGDPTYVENGGWLNGPAFPPQGYLSSKVVADHGSFVNGGLPVPQPNSFPFTLKTNVHPFANTGPAG